MTNLGIRSRVMPTVLIALILVIVSAAAQAQSARSEVPDEVSAGIKASSTLDGMWRAVVSFGDEFSLRVLFTFNNGVGNDSGTLIDQNEYQYTPNPICTADQGVWERTGNDTFIATHYAFCFDTEHGNAPAGSVRVRDNIKVDQKKGTFVGTQYIELLDADDNVLDTVEATMRGERIGAQAPPAVPSSAPKLDGRTPLGRLLSRR